jgi:hypothetical protein
MEVICLDKEQEKKEKDKDRKETKKAYLLLLGIILCGVVIGYYLINLNYKDADLSAQTDGSELVIPEGYIFVDASSYGKLGAVETYYLKKEADGQIYKYDGKNIRGKVSVPEGHTFICASTYGCEAGITTYYLKNNSNNKIYTFKG